MALNFDGGSAAYTLPSGELDFGGAAPPPALPSLDFSGGSAAYTLPSDELDFGASGPAPPPTPQPAPGIINTLAAPWRDTHQRIAAALVAAWQNARGFTRSVAVPFETATVKDRETAAAWSNTRQFNRDAQLRWQNANPMAREKSAVWRSQIPHRDAYAAIPWAKHTRTADRVETTVWLSPAPKTPPPWCSGPSSRASLRPASYYRGLRRSTSTARPRCLGVRVAYKTTASARSGTQTRTRPAHSIHRRSPAKRSIS